ncbi:MAG TPA: 50S ribosomal protein L11 methyltransferase [Labilithrix sp.]|jgi:predicted nicotinamide N-methyase
MTAKDDFVRMHTALTPVPLVPEIALFTVNALTPLWRATEEWLGERGVEVPFWSVPWAGGQALARWVLDHPEAVRGLSVIDVGAGGGLVAIAAALAGAARVRAVDLDPLASAACAMNAAHAGVAIEIVTADAATVELDADVVLAGDVWYDRVQAERLAARLRACGARVLTGDPSRAYAPPDLETLAIYEVPTPPDLESASVRTTRVCAMLPAR